MDFGTLALGLFAGAGATLLWELVLRPKLTCRAIAEVLAAEVSINLQLLGAAASLANPRQIPSDFSLSTKVFESIVERIGELPPRLVAEVVFLYRYFFELNGHPTAFTECVKELRTYDPRSSNFAACEKELLAQADVFNQYVDKAISRVNLVQPLLLKAAFPWWSIRRWRRPAEAQLKLSELQQQIVKSMREREALAAEIAKQSRSDHV